MPASIPGARQEKRARHVPSNLERCSVFLRVTGVPPGAAASVTFACVLLFVVAFSLGSGPLPFLYLSELLSSGIKGRVSSIATALNWAANLAVGMSFPVMIASLGIGGSYLIYGLINVACMLFCLLLMVETKRRPIHEIEDMLLHA